ncbi:hypothetical protein [Priestia megaterium]|uniref:hypothetical protein n=1 Tax=Priestia megaterium TaxID=1404 RepID=UPI000BFD0CA9|nr:hypothetical protein [Priestia megaterium]PGQ88317.1 hypothetical protein COA18_05150 [Priestia megaterium]
MQKPSKTANSKVKPYTSEVKLNDIEALTPELISQLNKEQVENLLNNYSKDMTQEQIAGLQKQRQATQQNSVVQLHSQKSADTPNQEVLQNVDTPKAKQFGLMPFNLDVDLIDAINDYIAQEQRANIKMWDDEAQKEKKINKSLWARVILRKALEDANYEPTPIPKRGE